MTPEQAMESFRGDRFALDVAGIQITAVGEKTAECTLALTERHCNALGRPMGGLIFTLADFCFAVAANHVTQGTLSQTAQISFLAAARGSTLITRARCIRDGRTSCLYQVEVRDELDTLVAYVTVTGYHTNQTGGAS